MEGPAQVSQQAEAVVEPARAADEGEGARLPDMTYTEQETELRSAVRSVLEDRADFNAVLARTETADTYDTALWRTLAAEVGCAGLEHVALFVTKFVVDRDVGVGLNGQSGHAREE